MALSNLLAHLKVCKYSTKYFLPKLWVPPKEKDRKKLEGKITCFYEILNEKIKKADKRQDTFEAMSTRIESKINEFKQEVICEVTTLADRRFETAMQQLESKVSSM